MIRAEQEDYPYYFDEDEVRRRIQFLSMCRHTKGVWARKPFHIQPFQAFIQGCIFGWKHKSDGYRRFTRAFHETAKKSGKSEFMAAAIGLSCALQDNEEGAEIYTAATTAKQARIVFERMKSMAKMLRTDYADIERIVDVKMNAIRINSTESIIEPLSSENDKDGKMTHCAIIDEYFAHPNNQVVDDIITGMGARRQPIIFYISTSGYTRTGPYYTLKTHAKNVLRGVVEDETLFVLIFTLDEGDDWEDKSTWVKANPQIGETPTWRFMEEQYSKAKSLGGQYEVEFKTKNLNITVDSHDTWIPDTVWQQRIKDIPDDELKDRPCYAGLDLAATDDLNAFVLYFPEYKDQPPHLKSFFFAPEEKIKNRKKIDKVDYVKWEQSGHIVSMPGNSTDYKKIAAFIENLYSRYKIKYIGFDRKFAVGVIPYLVERDIPCEPISQSVMEMNAPTKLFWGMVMDGNLTNDGNPVMRWNIANVAVQRDHNDNWKILKGKSTGKVDGAVAAVMAINIAAKHPSTVSVYEQRFKSGEDILKTI